MGAGDFCRKELGRAPCPRFRMRHFRAKIVFPVDRFTCVAEWRVIVSI